MDIGFVAANHAEKEAKRQAAIRELQGLIDQNLAAQRVIQSPEWPAFAHMDEADRMELLRSLKKVEQVLRRVMQTIRGTPF